MSKILYSSLPEDHQPTEFGHVVAAIALCAILALVVVIVIL